MFKRVLTVLSLLTVAVAAFGSANRTASAQAEPTAIIDAAFNDLNAKLGTSLSRTKPSNSSYTWEQVTFGSPALGCPTAGQNYAQILTPGYKIIITVNGTAYDYRASADGKLLFQCASANAPAAATGAASATVTAIPAASQPRSYVNPLAYIGLDHNVYVMQIGAAQGSTALTTDANGAPIANFPFFQTLHTYSFLRWSPDGLNLAFVGLSASTSAALYVARSGQAPQIIARGIAAQFPPFWLPNGQEVGFLVAAGATDPASHASKLQIQAISVGGGSPRVLGELTYVHQPGDVGSFDVPVDDLAYFDEAGGYGNGAIFANTKSGGFLYTTNYSNIGLGFTPGASGGWQRPDLGRAALSPDGTQLIALRFDTNNKSFPQAPISLEKVDLATGTSSTLASQPGIDQIGWADNNTILYSTLTAPKTLAITATLTNALATMFALAPQPKPLTGYTVTLWKMPAAGGSAVQLNAASGRAIGLINGAPDGATTVYSFIPSMEAAVNALNSNQNNTQALRQAIPFPVIMAVSLNSQTATNIISGGRPTLATGTFVAVGPAPVAAPIVAPPSVNQAPPALFIGGQALVSVTGDALNLRQNPTKGAQVVRLIKAGVVVTVVGGPANAEGLRWWQIKLADGTSGWVADQVIDSSGTTNTLTPQ